MARSIIDKCDVACIVCRVTQEEEELISDIPTNIIPNQVMDVYKVRRGRYTNVKIWSYADLGTCRKEDLFVTTAELDTVEGYKRVDFVFTDEDEEDLDLLLTLNNGKDILPTQKKEEEKVIDLNNIKAETEKKGLFDGLY